MRQVGKADKAVCQAGQSRQVGRRCRAGIQDRQIRAGRLVRSERKAGRHAEQGRQAVRAE
jgi:hypothetical protein